MARWKPTPQAPNSALEYPMNTLGSSDGTLTTYDRAKLLPVPARAQRHWRWTGFRGTLGGAIIATVIAVIINIVLLAWASTRPTSSLGTKVLFFGDCSYSASRSVVAHLAINVLGTVLLAASNAAMQILVAPNREVLDRAHERGAWLYVGVGSVKNFLAARRGKQALWIILLLTSIPLHLLYNSVIIQSTAASEYYAIVATQDFLHGGPIDTGEFGGGIALVGNATLLSTLQPIQAEAHTYKNLSLSDCLTEYGDNFIIGRTNVVVVTNITTAASTKADSSVLFAMYFEPFVQNSSYSLFYPTPINEMGTDEDSYLFYPYIRNGEIPYPILPGDIEDFRLAKVEYCLSKEVPPACSLELHPTFLTVVIVANFLKLVCFALLLFRLMPEQPLITVGDAIASYLEQPELLTEGGRIVSRRFLDSFKTKVVDCLRTDGTLYQPKHRLPWLGNRSRWFHATGSRRRSAMVALTFAWFVLGALGLSLGFRGLNFQTYDDVTPSLSTLWATGFGNVYQNNVLNYTLGWSVSSNIILANLPQLFASLLYVVYNQYFTLMLTAHETSKYALRRDFLRVSEPQEGQYGSYWLSMPLKYGIPLMVSSAFLHWAISQSLFLAEVSVVMPNGVVDDAQHMNTVGYSQLGLLITFLIGTVMLLVLIGMGLFRRFPGIVPVIGSCSLALSAACHGHEGRPNEAVRSLMYGVVDVTSQCTGRVGFSGEPVEALQKSWYYDGIAEPPKVKKRIPGINYLTHREGYTPL